MPEHRDAVLEDLAKTLRWGPDMDYRLRDLSGRTARLGPDHRDREAGARDGERGVRALLAAAGPQLLLPAGPLVVVGDRAVRGSMATPARPREPLLSGYVLSLHPRFANPEGGKFWFQEFSGGLRQAVLLCAHAADARRRGRPGPARGPARDRLLGAHREDHDRAPGGVPEEAQSPIRRIIVVAIPPERSYMHLDTVFTVISREECLVYGPDDPPGRRRGGRRLPVRSGQARDHVDDREGSALGAEGAELDLEPIRCGGRIRSPSGASSGPTAPTRSPWRPGVVLLYDRNEATAAELARAGYTVVDEADLLLGREELELWKPEKKYVDPPRGARALARPRRPALHDDAARARRRAELVGTAFRDSPSRMNPTPFFSFVRPLAVVAFGGNALLRPEDSRNDRRAARARAGGRPQAPPDPRKRLRAHRRARQRPPGRQHPDPGRGGRREGAAAVARLLRGADGGIDGFPARARLRQRAAARRLPQAGRRRS